MIPMIVHHETKEREKQQKENEKKEEEMRSTVNVEEQHIDETEINESKSRVYEHFKQICKTTNKEVAALPKKKKKKKSCNQLTLGQMHGRKRKRESDIKNEIQVKRNNDFSTPTPPLDIKVMHMPKKIKREVQETSEEGKTHNNNSEIVTSIR